MDTLKLKSFECDKASQIIKSGGIVAIPTETVYGLAASVFDEDAIKKIFTAKGRPSDNPLIVHIANLNDIYDVVSEFPETAKKLASKFWPGPLTLILPKNDKIPYSVSAGMDSVAVRFPANKISQKIILKSGVPLVAPSANISGKPSPTKFEHVVKDLDGKVDAIVDGGSCGVGVESTVLSLIGEIPRILRPGAITVKDLEQIIGKVEVDKAVYENIKPGQAVLSPGMKYKHYSPNAEVYIVKGSSYCQYVNSKINENSKKDIIALCFNEDVPYLKAPYITYGSKNNFNEQARNLFDALRKVDELDFKIVYAHFENNNDVGLAVYNRLVRAAGFKIIEL